MVELTTAARLLAIAPNPSVDRLLTVDALRHGEIHRPTSVTVVPGGKGFNLSAADVERIRPRIRIDRLS